LARRQQNGAFDPKPSFDAGPVTPMLIRPRRLRFDPAQAVVRSNLHEGINPDLGSQTPRRR
jgi:hypothetical protein